MRTFLERFADMGLDAVDPLGPPPYGDNDLAKAIQRGLAMIEAWREFGT